jgi:hypothetical protein
VETKEEHDAQLSAPGWASYSDRVTRRVGEGARGWRRAVWVLVPAALVLAAGCGGPGTSSDAAASASASPTVHGNGVAKLSGTEILKQAAKVSAAARSVRIRGKVSDQGEVIALSLRIAGPKAAAGTMIVHGQRIGLIRLGSVAYIKGDAKFWNAAGGPNAVTMFSGKYLKTAANDKDFKDLMSLTIASKVFAELTKPEGEVTKGAAAQVHGTPAITLLDGTGGNSISPPMVGHTCCESATARTPSTSSTTTRP